VTCPAILFDIDGTLLYVKGVGRVAFGKAFEAAYGVTFPNVGAINFVGATDSAVVRGMAAECGRPTSPAREEHFFFRMAQELDAAFTAVKPLIYPGVPELLARLAQRGHALGLITGNVRATAWSKVRHAGIDHFFSFGAYGDDHPDRAAIAALAVARAPAGGAARLLVGDTPLDVRAAHANGLKALAVATGWIAAEKLAAAGADRVLPDFSDTAAAVAAIDALLRERERDLGSVDGELRGCQD
jgi:phosphoglycolate phosphatase-like HAD superfamily hydrolase